MLEVGKPCIRDTEQFTTNSGDLITLSQFRGKVILLAFFDIIKGWDWFIEFSKIPGELFTKKNISSDDFQFIAVLFNYGDFGKEKINKIPYSGPVNNSWVNTKLDLFSIDSGSFLILPNGEWTASLASDFEYGFFKDNDPLFSGNTGEKFFSYLLTDSLFVADKWSTNTTDNNERISFNVIAPKNGEHIITGIHEADGSCADRSTKPDASPVVFYSKLLHNTKYFIYERVTNLLAPPYILDVNPSQNSGIHELNEVKIIFSKPVIDTAANNVINYSLEGGSKGSLEIVAVDYMGRNLIENTARLKFQGRATANMYDNEIKIAINRAHITDLSGNKFENDTNIIRYSSDIELPEVSLHPEFCQIHIGGNNPNDLKSVVVRFSKPVLNALNPDFYHFTTKGIEIFYIVALENNEYLVNFKITDNSLLHNGDTVLLTIDNNAIVDDAGHKLKNNELSILVYDGNLYIVTSPEHEYTIGPGFESKPTFLHIEYSERVNCADDQNNYTFSNENFKVNTVKKIDEITFQLEISVIEPLNLIGETEVVLYVNQENIQNDNGQTLQNNEIRYKIDCEPLRIDFNDMGRNLSLGSKAKNGINKFTLKFSKPTLGADNPVHYSFSNDLVTITGIEKIRDDVYLLNIYVAENFPTYRDEKVKLELNGEAITDFFGNRLKDREIEFSVSSKQPSIIKSSSASNMTLGTRSKTRDCPFTLSFSEPVFGVENRENYSFTVNGFWIKDIVRIDQMNYEITIHVEEYVPVGNNDEVIMFLNVNEIINNTGNMLANNAVTFTIDMRPPVMTVEPPFNSTISSLTEIHLAFSKAINGFDNCRNNIRFEGHYGSLQVDPNPVHSYNSINNTAVIKFIGELDEDIYDEYLDIYLNEITDDANNELDNNKITYRIDTVKPQFIANSSLRIGTNTTNHKAYFNLTFNKPMKHLEYVDNYSFNKGGIDVSRVNVINDRECAIEINIHNAAYLHHGEEIKLILNEDDIRDQIGNRLKDNLLPFTVDANPPSIRTYPESKNVIHELNQIEISFSKEVVGANNWDNYIFTKTVSGISLAPPFSHSYDEKNNKVRLFIAGALEEDLSGESIELTIVGIKDIAQNEIVNNIITYTVDTVKPEIRNVDNPVLGALSVGGNNYRTIFFSKPVNGADDITHYYFHKEGVSVLGVEQVSPLEYRLLINFNDIARFNHNDELVLNLDSNAVMDQAGNKLKNNFVNFTVDKEYLRFSVDPADNTKLNSLPELYLQFSKTVIGATNCHNFSFVGAHGALSIASDSDCIYNSNNNLLKLIVTGTLAENLDDAGIALKLLNLTDPVGNVLEKKSISYIVNTQRPELLVRQTPILGTISIDGLNNFVFYITKPVKGATDPANYRFLQSDIKVLSIKHTGDSEYLMKIKIENVAGYKYNDKITLLIENDAIVDDIGNALKNTDIVFTVDDTPPVMNVFPHNHATINHLHELTIEFSKDVLHADNWSNYKFTATMDGISFNPSMAHSFHKDSRCAVLRFDCKLAEGIDNKKIQIFVNNVTDTIGNQLIDNIIEYTIDTVPPVISHVSTNVLGAKADCGKNMVTVSFSKVVLGVEELKNYKFNTKDISIDKIIPVSAKEYTFIINVPDSAPVSHNDEVIMHFNRDGITDMIGNSIADKKITFSVDAVQPAFMAVPPAGSIISSLDNIKLIFTKDVIGADNWKENYRLHLDKKLGNLQFATEIQHTYNKDDKTAIIRFNSSFKHNLKDKDFFLEISGITDSHFNVLSDNILSYKIDTVPPKIEDVPASVLYYDHITNSISIKYSKTMVGADIPQNYHFDTEGLTITKIILREHGLYEFFIDINQPTLSHGETFKLNISDAVTDTAGNRIDKPYVSLSFNKMKSLDLALVIDIDSLNDSYLPLWTYASDGIINQKELKDYDPVATIVNFLLCTWKPMLQNDDRVAIVFIDNKIKAGHIFENCLFFVDDYVESHFSDISKNSNHAHSTEAAFIASDKLLFSVGNPDRTRSILYIGKQQSIYSGFHVPDIKTPLYGIGIGDFKPWDFRFLTHNNIFSSAFYCDSIFPAITEYFLSHMAAIQNEHSLRFLTNRAGFLDESSSVASEDFAIATSTQWLAIQLVWYGNSPIKIQLFHGSNRVINVPKISNSINNYIIYISFPHNRDNKILSFKNRKDYNLRKNKDGSYSWDKRRKSNTPVTNVRMCEIHKKLFDNNIITLKINKTDKQNQDIIPYFMNVCGVDFAHIQNTLKKQPDVFTGHKINVGFSLNYDYSEPIDHIESQSIISERTNSVINLFNKHQTNNKKIMPNKKNVPMNVSNDEIDKRLDDIFTILHKDPVFQKEYHLTEFTSIPLESDKGKNIFSKKLNISNNHPCFLPGILTKKTLIKAFNKNKPILESIDYQTTLVFPSIDAKTTNIFAIYYSKSRIIVVTVIPHDSSKNLLGPGFSDAFKGKICGKDIDSVRDNLDGSYEIEVRITKKEDLNSKKSKIIFQDLVLCNVKSSDLVQETITDFYKK